MNAIATREAAAAQRTAQQQLLQSLGVPDADALKALVDAQKAAEEAGKTDLQKQQDAAAKAAQDAANDRAAAAAERFEAKVERAFAKAGIEIEDPKFARLRRMVTLEPSADAAAIDAELATLKTDFPGLFGGPAGGGTPPPAPGSDPKGTPPPTPPGSKSAIERGRERARQQAARSSNQPGGGYITPPGL